MTLSNHLAVPSSASATDSSPTTPTVVVPPNLSDALPEPRIEVYRRWLADRRGLHFERYEDLWRWSVTDLPAFWQSIWDHFDLHSPTRHDAVLTDDRMPGARWFAGASVNYAQQVMRHADRAHEAGHPAIVWADEAVLAEGRVEEITWPALRAQVAALAGALRGLGVQPGDRVAAYLPNRPEAVVAFLAVVSVGAVWSVCSPDMGPVAVLDRFRQIEPRVLIACDASRYGGAVHDRSAMVAGLLEQLPSVQHVVQARLVDDASVDLATGGRPLHRWESLTAGDAGMPPADPTPLPFDHPLWIVYSSGTTGLPKPIVHGHGGVIVEALKLGALHNDIGASIDTGDRFCWTSSTGWIMWNSQVGALLGGTTICLFDGAVAGPSAAPDWGTLWRFAALARCTFVGAGAAFYAGCAKAGVEPQAVADLSALRAVGSTGSPLSEDGYRWIWDRLPRPGGLPMWIACISGGTDFAGAFLAGLRTLPMVAGEMQCRCLGAAVEAFGEADAEGRAVSLMDEVGELVCTRPMPSMPLFLWGDGDGQRLRDSYFDMYPGVWRHGDWLRLIPHDGATGAVIYGRSDATINRHGVRMGTAELYRAVEAEPAVLDSLVVDLEYLGRPSFMPLFVVLRDGHVLDDALVQRLRQAIRQALSPRHVPDAVIQAPAVPRTLSGKKMELPVKKLLLGADAAKVMNRDAMANGDAVPWYVAYAQRYRDGVVAGPG